LRAGHDGCTANDTHHLLAIAITHTPTVEATFAQRAFIALAPHGIHHEERTVLLLRLVRIGSVRGEVRVRFDLDCTARKAKLAAHYVARLERKPIVTHVTPAIVHTHLHTTLRLLGQLQLVPDVVTHLLVGPIAAPIAPVANFRLVNANAVAAVELAVARVSRCRRGGCCGWRSGRRFRGRRMRYDQRAPAGTIVTEPTAYSRRRSRTCRGCGGCRRCRPTVDRVNDGFRLLLGGSFHRLGNVRWRQWPRSERNRLRRTVEKVIHFARSRQHVRSGGS